MDFEELLQDSSPENIRLAETIRELGRFLPRNPQVDWEELRGRCGDVLQGQIKDSNESRELTTLLEGKPYIIGGDEHDVVQFESKPDRVYKFTRNNSFGCNSYFSPHRDPATLRHFHAGFNADPFFYLLRWILLNWIGGFKTRFEGFVLPERPGWLPRICISQPLLPLDNPTEEQIRNSMAVYGFYEVSEYAFYDPESGLLLTDALSRNVRVVEGIPVPFDAIAQFADPRVREWCKEQHSRKIRD